MRSASSGRQILVLAVLVAVGIGVYARLTAPKAASAPEPTSNSAFKFDSPPTLLAPTRFTLNIPASDDRSSPATVDVQFVMPAMAMPENDVTLTQTKPGVYSGTTTLTMSGDWVAIAAIKIPGAPVKKQRFPFTVP